MTSEQINIRQSIDRITSFASTDQVMSAQIEKARVDFFTATGEIAEEDRSFEMRLTGFLDWFILDRLVTGEGKTPARLFYERNESSFQPAEKDVFKACLGSIHSIFEVMSVDTGLVTLKNYYDNKTYDVMENDILLFKKGDILESRLLKLARGYHFSGAFCYHPPEVKKYILGKINAAKEKGYKDLNTVFHKLMMMSLKAERYKKISSLEIYNDASRL
jgi:hypothetical protein